MTHKPIKQLDRYTMNNTEQIWYSINELNNLFGLSKTIIKRRIKNNSDLLVPDKTIKSIKSQKGKQTNLYHFQILNKVFGVRNKPQLFSLVEVRRKYIGSSKWDFIGTILPERSSVLDLQYKMKYLNQQIRSIYGKRYGIKLFYSIEPNPIDKYYHSHFLISSKIKIEDLTIINNLLEVIAGEKVKDKTPVKLEKYDFEKYGFTGSFYSFKHKSVFDEYLEI
jgi:hypothetical protein